MPLPESLARFNRAVTNRISKPLARRLPSFAVVRHVGRKSGVVYETPVNAWMRGDRIVIALTYGPNVDWLKNTEVSGESVIIMQSHEIRVGHPERMSEVEGRAEMPAVVRIALRLIDVDDFVAFPIRREGN